jgi:DNA-binding response OmpR family regulator
MAKTILVVDDKVNVRTLVRDYLTAENFRVVTASNGRDALYVARDEKPDLILLDIMMPEMTGYELLKAYRKERNTPVILLTAKLEESDKVLGLELGADDYVTKPFGMRELVARIRAVLRRVGQETPSEVLRAADIVIDKSEHSVTVNNRPVRLTPSEFEMLATLMSVCRGSRLKASNAPSMCTFAISEPRLNLIRASRVISRPCSVSVIDSAPRNDGVFQAPLDADKRRWCLYQRSSALVGVPFPKLPEG